MWWISSPPPIWQIGIGTVVVTTWGCPSVEEIPAVVDQGGENKLMGAILCSECLV